MTLYTLTSLQGERNLQFNFHISQKSSLPINGKE